MMKNYEQVFQLLLSEELANGCHAQRLLFLDGGKNLDNLHSELIWQKLQTKQNSDRLLTRGEVYPNLGQIPNIDETKFNFLHSDITEACICLGCFYGDQIYCRWWGRNAQTPVQMWSVTKIMPMLLVLLNATNNQPTSSYLNWQIGQASISEIYDRIMDYSDPDFMTSNALAGMLKQFFNPAELTNFLMTTTGSQNIEFTGLYGEPVFIRQPHLIDIQTKQTLLAPSLYSYQVGQGQNLVSAYALTRLMSLIGWHFHLPNSARIPCTNSHNLQLLVDALCRDNARYVQRLQPNYLVLSKMGFGYSDERQRTEIAYTCYLKMNESQSLCLTLRGSSSIPDLDLSACRIDARMATVIMEILDWVNDD